MRLEKFNRLTALHVVFLEFCRKIYAVEFVKNLWYNDDDIVTFC